MFIKIIAVMFFALLQVSVLNGLFLTVVAFIDSDIDNLGRIVLPLMFAFLAFGAAGVVYECSQTLKLRKPKLQAFIGTFVPGYALPIIWRNS